jgi:trk system potassium uptake protein
MKSIAIIGVGQFGYHLAVALSQKGYEIIAIDEKEEIITEIKDLVSQAVILDATDEKAMRAVNIDSVDKAVVAFGSSVQSSLLTTALLQKMSIQEIYVRQINTLQESILKSMGIKNLISIEEEMGSQVANTISSQGVGRYVSISNRHSLIEISVPDPLVGKTLADSNIRAQYGINIVGIKTRNPEIKDDGEVSYEIQMTDIPDPRYALKKEDLLVVAGTDDNLNRFMTVLGKDV